MAKLPEAGHSKTRLIPAIGVANAAALSATFLRDLVRRLACASLGAECDRILCYAPATARAQFQALLADLPEAQRYKLLAQSSGDLGARLAAALQRVRGQRTGAVVFIGSDAPDLPLETLRDGFDHAEKGQAYLKPAHDGGYVLLALPAAALHTVFLDIDWSSPHTCTQQAARLRALGVPTIVSNSKWWDVDEPDDLRGLQERLHGNPALAPETLALLNNILV